MKRRDFLGTGIGTLGVPALALAGTSLYGTPASVDAKVATAAHERLSFAVSRLNLPEEAAVTMAQTSHMWFDVLTDSAARSAFMQDPNDYVSRRGLAAVAARGANDMQLLAACCDPDVAKAAEKQDYDAFFAALLKHGISVNHESEVKQRVSDIIENDYENFAATVRTVLEGTSDSDVQAFFAGEDTEILLTGLSSAYQKSCTAIAGCLVAAVIAATIAAYVSVGVAATVGLAVAVYIVAAHQVVVTITTTKPKSELDGMTRRLKLYGPTVVESFQRLSRVAAITKSTPLLLEKYQQMLGVEVRAIFEAAERKGLIEVSNAQREEVYAAVERGCMRMLGATS